jgi:hypothetical protein
MSQSEFSQVPVARFSGTLSLPKMSGTFDAGAETSIEQDPSVSNKYASLKQQLKKHIQN